MSATDASTKTNRSGRAKTKTKTTTKSKAERAEINRRNAQKSTGPRTAEGKDVSRFNATKHGLTAKSELLPAEDPREFMERRQRLLDDLKPRNELEAVQIGQIAAHVWRSDRGDRVAEAQTASRVRHERLEQAKRETDEARTLGKYLLWRPHLPLPIQTSDHGWQLTEPPWANSYPHAYHAARLLLDLEQTIPGCEWLLECWQDLSWRLGCEGEWGPSCAFKMVRLMGKLAIDMDEDFEVARVLLCSLTLIGVPQPGPSGEPIDWKSALLRMLFTYKNESSADTTDAEIARQFDSFNRRLAELPLARFATESVEEARRWLSDVINHEIDRITPIVATLREIAEADALEAPLRLALETGPDGDKFRRYVVSNGRLANRTIDEFLKMRTLSSVVGGPFSGVSCEAATVEVPARSLQEQASCDDHHFLRNEANATVVSGPLSVVSCEAAAIDEPAAPVEFETALGEAAEVIMPAGQTPVGWTPPTEISPIGRRCRPDEGNAVVLLLLTWLTSQITVRLRSLKVCSDLITINCIIRRHVAAYWGGRRSWRAGNGTSTSLSAGTRLARRLSLPGMPSSALTSDFATPYLFLKMGRLAERRIRETRH
jgi:hypothetical protein